MPRSLISRPSWRRRFSAATWRRPFRAALLLPAALALVVTGAACRQDMHDAPRVEAFETTDAFEDGRGGRPLVEGTVARGWLNDDELLTTGKVNGQLVDQFPFPVTREVLERGQQRFNAFCTPCHGRTGSGNGMIVQRGLRPPPSFHDERQRSSPVGHYFDVMSNGLGVMQDYRAQVEVNDRWAIAAYIRALQLSQRATVADVPHDKVGDLDKPQTEAPAKPAPSHGSGH